MKVPKPKKLKSGNYYIYLRLGGVGHSITRSTAKECTRAAELIKAEHRANNSPKISDSKDKTLRKLMQAYIDRYRATLSPSTLYGYDQIIKHRFNDYIDRPYDDIKDWQKVVDAEISKYKPKTVRNEWSFLCSAIRDAKLPIPDVKLPAPISSTRPYLVPDEVQKLIAVAKDDKSAIPVMLALHGLRRGEIAGLTWEDVDLKNNRINIHQVLVRNDKKEWVRKDTAKTKKGNRQIPIMIPELSAALSAVPVSARSGPVCPCHVSDIYNHINRLCRAANVPEIGVHGCRHAFASLGHSLSVPINEMMLLGGWDDLATMQKIYTHIGEQEMLSAKNKFANFFEKT